MEASCKKGLAVQPSLFPAIETIPIFKYLLTDVIMASSPWILVAATFQIAMHIEANQHPKAEIRFPVQFVVNDRSHDNFTLTLDGSLTTGGDIYEWKEMEKPTHSGKAEFTSKDQLKTNVTIGKHNGFYKFRLRAKSSNHRRSDAFSKVYVEEKSSVGMYLFASQVVSQLLKLRYQYIFLSQHYDSAERYRPKVAEYFRKLSLDRASMLEDVTKHVLEKQATEELIHSCPTNYVKVMLSKGFKKEISYVTAITDIMTSSFEVSKEAEAELGRQLAVVSHYATKNNDYELSDFVASVLLPRVTNVLNQHKNHLETTLRKAEGFPTQERHLAEFLFDKYLKF